MVKEWVPPKGPPPEATTGQGEVAHGEPLAELEGLAQKYTPLAPPASRSHLLRGRGSSRANHGSSTAPSGPPPKAAARSPGRRREWVAFDLALVFIGGACFALSYFTATHGAVFPNRSYPLWALFIGLGVIATAGGLLSIYVGPDPPGLQREDIDLQHFVIVERRKWNEMRAELGEMKALLRARAAGGALPRTPAWALEVRRPPSAEEHTSVLTELRSVGDRPSPYTTSPAFAPPALQAPAPASAAKGLPSERPVKSSRPAPSARPEPHPSMVVEGTGPGQVPTELLQRELETQLRDVLERNAPVPDAPAPLAPGTASSPPVTVALPPAAVTSPAAVVDPPAAEEARETYDEEAEEPSAAPEAAPGPNGDAADHLAEIEDLARRFAAVAQPAGALQEAPSSRTPAQPSPPAAPAAAPGAEGGALPAASKAGAPQERWQREAAAMRAALDLSIDRAAGEPPEEVVARAEAQLEEWTRSPPPSIREIDRAQAFVSSMLESQRQLSAPDLERLSQIFRDRVTTMGKAVGLPLRPDETLVAYALRLKDVLTAADPRREKLPQPAAGPTPGAPAEPRAEELDDELERMVQDLVDTTLPAAGPASNEKKRRKERDDASGKAG